MKRVVLPAMALLLAILSCPTQDSIATQQKGGIRKLMDDKLRYAKMLLEAVAVNNYAKAEMSAEKLIALSKSADWAVHKTARYELHSNEFRRAAENMVKKAKAKSNDGMAYGYVELTMACFRCHQYVREIQDAKFDDPTDLTH